MRLKSIRICLLCAVLLAASLFSGGLFAASGLTGTGVVVVDDALNVREGPGTNYRAITTLKNGVAVEILESKTGTDGAVWYRIRCASVSDGYVRSDYIRVDAPPDADFETSLTAQGFPESYKPALRALHAKYPKWVFIAQPINLNFETVLDAEMQGERSLVGTGSLASWKSMESGAYDWTKKTYNTYSGGNWVKASREILAYFLDPRNFLDETYIFQFESQSYSAAHTLSGVNGLLRGTFMAGNYTCPDTKETRSYAQTFLDVAKETNVSAYHLASRARLEQGVNGSPLGLGTVPNYPNIFNFYNIRANGSTTADVLRNGAIYAAASDPSTFRPWTNQYKSIRGGAIFIGENYINKGQDTPYLEKFDVVDGGNGLYSHQYMQSIQAPYSEARNTRNGYSADLLSGSPFVFRIPIYLNMPTSPCPKPTSSGNNDNTLTALGVTGQSLTPTFNRYTTSYELVVDANVSSVTVTATRSDPGASVTGTGSVPLKTGDNTVSVVVTAPSGVMRTYTLHISRRQGSTGGDTRPYFSGSYTVGSEITGVQPGTSVSTFLTGLGVKNGTAQLFTAAGAQKASGTVGTGDVVRVYAGSQLVYTYSVVIYGDINGDGKISGADRLRLQHHFLGTEVQTGVYSKACDVSRDGKISGADRLRMQKFFLGTEKIEQ